VTVSLIGGGNQSTGEKYRPVASRRQTLSHNIALSTPHLCGIQIQKVCGDIGTDCIGSCK
jgi:hypothetical protein